MSDNQPTVPVARVVRRIVNQTADALAASKDLKNLRASSVIGQHPARDEIILWLAEQKLGDLFDKACEERGISFWYTYGSPDVAATEEDLKYEPPED